VFHSMVRQAAKCATAKEQGWLKWQTGSIAEAS
jgi:hypothetical protein